MEDVKWGTTRSGPCLLPRLATASISCVIVRTFSCLYVAHWWYSRSFFLRLNCRQYGHLLAVRWNAATPHQPSVPPQDDGPGADAVPGLQTG
uniref:Uncharacterized protein n=1 Tax=Hyaloperonospora arabidopsidis (strain Emoy2) TaxID=559515 RepID=M4BSE0_HYAAE